MRISEKFKELEEKGEKALILYISCGDPSAEETIKIARSIIDAGCDILELGMGPGRPFDGRHHAADSIGT